MTQSDMVLDFAGVSGASFAGDAQAIIRAVATWQSGAGDPGTLIPHLVSVYTGSSPWIVRMRNAANDGWIELFRIDDGDDTVTLTLKLLSMTGQILAASGVVGAPGYGFLGDEDTGLFNPAADQAAVTAGGVQAALFGTTFADLPLSARLSGAISPAALSANQNDFNPAGLSGASVVRLDASTGVTITGLQGGTAGRLVFLSNISSQTITLAHQNTGSSAANRFHLPNTTNFAIVKGGGVLLWYDGAVSRWRMLAASAASSSSGTFESAEKSIGNSSLVSAAHGFGQVPFENWAALRCKVAEHGYSVGAEVSDWFSSSLTVSADATNCYLAHDGGNVQVIHKTTFANQAITFANWRWVLKAKL